MKKIFGNYYHGCEVEWMDDYLYETKEEAEKRNTDLNDSTHDEYEVEEYKLIKRGEEGSE